MPLLFSRRARRRMQGARGLVSMPRSPWREDKWITNGSQHALLRRRIKKDLGWRTRTQIRECLWI